MDGKKTLEKYLRPSSALTVIGVILLAFGIVIGAAGAVLVLLLELVVGALLLWVGLSPVKTLKKQLEELETQGRLPGVIREFESGKQFLKDKLRLGPTYILGKKSGVVLTYDQVKKIYQHVHRTNFVEDRREIRVETTEGKIISLCPLPLKGKGDEELVRIISVIKTMNPGVHIGYK